MSHATEEEWNQRKANIDIQKIENTKFDMLVAGPDSVNIGAIFGLFLTDVGTQFLENIGHYFMFPIAAAGSILRTYFAWKDKQLNEGKNGTTRKFALEVVSALAITTAVVGSFFWSAISTLISPIIFTVVMSAKTLFHGSSSVYYGWKAHKASQLAKAIGDDGDQIQRNEARDEAVRCAKFAKAHAVGFVAGALATTAVVLVMIIAKPVLMVIGAISGVVSGVIGAVFATVTFCKLRKPKSPAEMRAPLIPSNELQNSDAPAPPSPSSKMHKTIGVIVAPDKTDVPAPVVVLQSPTSPAGHRNSFVATTPKNAASAVTDRSSPAANRPVLAGFN